MPSTLVMREIKAPPGAKDLPYSDGEPMETERHHHQMVLLIQSLRHHLRDRPDVYVAGNLFVYFSETQTRKNDFRGPDVFVVLGTNKRERLSWVAWEEDSKLPDIVIELVSPSTEAVDRGRKKDLYERVLKVSRYYLFDPFTARLDGYALTERFTYEPIPPGPNGDLPCSLLSLSLGVRETLLDGDTCPLLRWIDAEGHVVPSPEERADAQTQRADAEKRRADALALRVAELESRYGSLG